MKQKPSKQQKHSREHEQKKHAEPLKTEMPFDELISRIVRVKPPAKN